MLRQEHKDAIGEVLPTRFVILDFSNVSGVDATAVRSLFVALTQAVSGDSDYVYTMTRMLACPQRASSANQSVIKPKKRSSRN